MRFSQRGLGVAIVDEANLILIDEMRTPAMLSFPAAVQGCRHEMAARAVGALRPGVHFTADQAARTASLTEAGLTAVEAWLGIDNLYDAAHGGHGRPRVRADDPLGRGDAIAVGVSAKRGGAVHRDDGTDKARCRGLHL